MGPKLGTKIGRGGGRTQRGGEVQLARDRLDSISVEDLLSVEEYDRYLKFYHSLRFTASQFFCNIDDINGFGFGFKELLAFQNLGIFLRVEKYI